MTLPQVDEIPYREARLALERGAAVRAALPLAETIFAKLDADSAALLNASRAVGREQDDDPAARDARDRAVDALYQALVGTLGRFRSELQLRTTDALGRVIDPAGRAEGQALLDRWLPEGGAAELPTAPDRLVTAVQSIQGASADIAWAVPLFGALTPLVDAVRTTGATVRAEAEELRVAFERLEERREDLRRTLRAARLCTRLVAVWFPDSGVDPDVVFPTRRRTNVQALADLDKAGAPEVPETDAD